MFLQIHACILDGMFLYVFWNVCFLEGMFLYVLKGMFCVFYVFRASTLFISTVMRHVFQITKTAGDPGNSLRDLVVVLVSVVVIAIRLNNLREVLMAKWCSAKDYFSL